jgi:ABC-type uncharacterized transport system permease subunit
MKHFLYILFLCFVIFGVSYYNTWSSKEALMLRGNSVFTNIPNSTNATFLDNLVNIKTQKLIK